MAIIIKNDEQISKMRTAGKILAEALDILQNSVKPGVTTKQLDEIAEKFIREKNCTASFYGYNGFPASICTSVNNEVIHGIPGLRTLKQGDIISIDIGVCYNGYHADAARTYPVGDISEDLKQLIDATKESFFKGLEFAVAGNHLYQISAAIEEYAIQFGYTMVRDFVGHGIGRNLHEDPQIPHYKQLSRGPKLQKGMTLAIEPMVNMGSCDVIVLDDDWTTVTSDGRYSAHYENTVLITEGEPEILTI